MILAVSELCPFLCGTFKYNYKITIKPYQYAIAKKTVKR